MINFGTSQMAQLEGEIKLSTLRHDRLRLIAKSADAIHSNL